jgi:predicted transcriptional regulator
MVSEIRPNFYDYQTILRLQREQKTAEQISKKVDLQMSTVVQAMEKAKETK